MAQASRPKKPAPKKPVKKAPAKPKPTPTPSKWQGIWQVIAYEIAGLICITAAIIGFFELGIVGRFFKTIGLFLLGNMNLMIPIALLVMAFLLMVKQQRVQWKTPALLGIGLITASFLIWSHSIFYSQFIDVPNALSDSVIRETWRALIDKQGVVLRSGALGGGMVGAVLFGVLHVLFDTLGAKLIAWVLLIVGILVLTGKALIPLLIEKSKNILLTLPKKEKVQQEATSTRKKRGKTEPVAVPKEAEPQPKKDEAPKNTSAPIISDFTKNIEPEVAVTEEIVLPTMTTENENYVLPSMQLLQMPAQHDQSSDYDSLQENAKKLEQTLASFGVSATVTEVHLGPAVTKYEVLPATGVKVSKIVSLQDDLALALAAKDIRMEAPIPGKSAIGIEVPNKDVAMVTLREVLQGTESNLDKKLLVALGRDITGAAITAELNKMPHLLVAGSTGSGKSVCINGIITSILMRTAPHEVKMMMIDPKMVELNIYNGIPHLLAPVVTDARKAAQALKKVVDEMERRYDLFAHTNTRNMEGYNKYVDSYVPEDDGPTLQRIPFIVVIVDELADLMMVASKEVEDAIMRLAQMARAAGIHLIIATQRPSVDVITGVIKANIPSRIAFAVSSAVDSRTILDGGGAERLLGRGDMLFLPSGASKPTRIQGAFLSDQEVESIVHHVISQQQAQYEEKMIPTDEEEAVAEDVDELYEQAVQLVIESKNASTSMLQRRFSIGYARAARIMDQLEEHGVVGPPRGSRGREVLVD
ncbi:cell division protein FtsK [Lysinibacillus sp. BF-4]|uniref:FtsK/SpoIIIE family DNA translocase n=1 Tax=Lysinibacillus sp. BF-4 TaxID=1473546 RepID=UPI0004FF9278|nr:cell division protein FtsK [Lysinibacillus sp. BF-4]